MGKIKGLLAFLAATVIGTSQVSGGDGSNGTSLSQNPREFRADLSLAKAAPASDLLGLINFGRERVSVGLNHKVEEITFYNSSKINYIRNLSEPQTLPSFNSVENATGARGHFFGFDLDGSFRTVASMNGVNAGEFFRKAKDYVSLGIGRTAYLANPIPLIRDIGLNIYSSYNKSINADIEDTFSTALSSFFNFGKFLNVSFSAFHFLERNYETLDLFTSLSMQLGMGELLVYGGRTLTVVPEGIPEASNVGASYRIKF